MGVWIEIASALLSEHIQASLPLWECGLKSCLIHQKFHVFCRHSLYGSVDWNNSAKWWTISLSKSLPLWECGLKLHRRIRHAALDGHSLYGSVDWNIKFTATLPSAEGHSLYGSVDWNKKLNAVFKRNIEGHSLYGSVDWNHAARRQRDAKGSHSLYGSVDWNHL